MLILAGMNNVACLAFQDSILTEGANGNSDESVSGQNVYVCGKEQVAADENVNFQFVTLAACMIQKTFSKILSVLPRYSQGTLVLHVKPHVWNPDYILLKAQGHA